MIYCRLENDCYCNIFGISLSPFNNEKFTTANIYFIGQSIRKKSLNSEIIPTQICPDIENSEHFKKQIFSILQYAGLPVFIGLMDKSPVHAKHA